MIIRKLSVGGGLLLALAGCKFPAQSPRETAGPPPLQPPTAASPAPNVAVAPAAQAAACACEDPAKAVLAKTSASRSTPARAQQHAAASRHRRIAYRSETSGHRGRRDGRPIHAEGDHARIPLAGDARYAASSRSYEERGYETEQLSSSYRSFHEGHVERYAEGDYAGGYGYGPTPSVSGAQTYSVSRGAGGDAARSRAWTRVRCPD